MLYNEWEEFKVRFFVDDSLIWFFSFLNGVSFILLPQLMHTWDKFEKKIEIKIIYQILDKDNS